MKTNVTNYDFHRAFESIRPDNFSYEGLNALYQTLTQWEEDGEAEYELDVIALCCEFSEYPSIEEAQAQYGEIALEDYTTLIEVANGAVIIQDF